MVAFVNGNGLRPGYVIKVKGDLYRVMAAEHRTPGKGKASMQAKLRKLKDGTQTEIKFRADESVERAEMEQVEMEYLYDDPSGLCFMNCETYEQTFLDDKVMGDDKKFLLPNARVKIEFCDDSPIGVSFPETVTLKVTDTEPPLKGATASGSGKPATLETGLVVTVPQFIQIGEMVNVSTTSGEYLERAKK
ncbi:MAG: elongation factor P [Nitrospina sp.]|jgi:elongation factor P|nr:elongation factor P [Nitrospina sp.]MBT3509087.1 elongation factor P [Nitrospina sp.]MBT3876731.1 elongation factor P [Nitrospina sp.]MBT4047858.1 elongation factor P [Nitrospina sp.]MBT4558581.1 elongation factor P [Nitrospina sp.]